MTCSPHPVPEGSSRVRMRLDRRGPICGKGLLLPLLSILILFCPGIGGVASAGVNVWTTNGPAGGDIVALAIDPSNPTMLYAGTVNGGVFKSTNGGQTWSPANRGLGDPVYGFVATVHDLAIDPSAPATLYAGTTYLGVFKSTNGGESWSAVNTGFPDIGDGRPGGLVLALAIDPTSPATIYAGTRSGFGGVFSGVFKSTNGGGSWSPINAGLTNSDVLALAIDPATPATLYAGTSGGGVFKSTNGGESWTAISIGLTNTDVFALAIDPSAPATLYAGTFGGGVFKSINGGGSWTPSTPA